MTEETAVVPEVVEVKPYCQNCVTYSKKTKKCLKTDKFTARKNTCEYYE